MNQLCLWSTEEIEGGGTAMSMESSLPEEPQLISAVEHEGSVTDIKVDNTSSDAIQGCIISLGGGGCARGGGGCHHRDVS